MTFFLIVKVRIFSLDEDLKPSQREVTITFIVSAINLNQNLTLPYALYK